MGQALYRKYRPRSLNDVVGEEPITRALKSALKSGQISHAYLFTGPRGVGKTSIARILAHEINGLEYSDDSNHIDIIEIDAASNRRIDEIRELRERVYIAPSMAKYKVYIIDEVHMLTKEAFNALLKTLEEPPAHVIFILATTDAHKLPETIISRTQRYTFKPITTDAAVKLLGEIAKKEKIDIDHDALKLLAIHGEGSLRDSKGLLDQARNQADKIDVKTVLEMLGLPPEEAINNLLNACLKGSAANEVISQISDMYEQGYQAGLIAKELGKTLRDKLINDAPSLEGFDSLDLLAGLIDVPSSHDPNRYLEVVLMRSLPRASGPAPQPHAPSYEPQEKKAEPSRDASTTSKGETQDEPSKEELKPTKKLPFDEKLWSELLSSLKKTHNTLYGVIRMASPSFLEDDKLELAFKFGFHEKKISESANQQILRQKLKDITGKNIYIECHVDKNAIPMELDLKPEPEQPEEKPTKDEVSTVSSIFKGAELLES